MKLKEKLKDCLTIAVMIIILVCAVASGLANEELSEDELIKELPKAGVIPTSKSTFLWKAEIIFENIGEKFYEVFRLNGMLNAYKSNRVMQRLAEYSTAISSDETYAGNVLEELNKIENRIFALESSKEGLEHSLKVIEAVRDRLENAGKPVEGIENAIAHRKAVINALEKLPLPNGYEIGETELVLIVEEEEF